MRTEQTGVPLNPARRTNASARPVPRPQRNDHVSVPDLPMARVGPDVRGSGLEPGERARHAAPQLAGAGGVVDRFALLAEHRVGGALSRQLLAAGQVGGDMWVELAR